MQLACVLHPPKALPGSCLDLNVSSSAVGRVPCCTSVVLPVLAAPLKLPSLTATALLPFRLLAWLMVLGSACLQSASLVLQRRKLKVNLHNGVLPSPAAFSSCKPGPLPCILFCFLPPPPGFYCTMLNFLLNRLEGIYYEGAMCAGIMNYLGKPSGFER